MVRTASVAAQAPLDRARVAVAEIGTQAAGHVPRPTRHVWTSVHDRNGHLASVCRVPERDPRAAWQRTVRDTHQRLREELAAGRVVADESRPIPADVGVEAPHVLVDATHLGGRRRHLGSNGHRAAGAPLGERRVALKPVG